MASRVCGVHIISDFYHHPIHLAIERMLKMRQMKRVEHKQLSINGFEDEVTRYEANTIFNCCFRCLLWSTNAISERNVKHPK